MSFFNLSDGTSASTTGTSFDAGGGNLEPIPANTNVVAIVDEAKWQQAKGTNEWHISLRWSVLMPKEYANRKVFQKVRVEETDKARRDKALRMLAAIDANAGGKLTAANRKPTDEDMAAALINKPMQIMVQVWEIDDPNTNEKKRGNWVSAVQAKNGAPAVQPAPSPAASQNEEFDDIPF